MANQLIIKTIGILMLCVVLSAGCRKTSDNIQLQGKYKMDYGFDVNSSNDTIFHQLEMLDRFIDFSDSSTLITSETIGVLGTYPVTIRTYTMENKTLHVDTSVYSPFTIEDYQYATFTLQSGNRYNVFIKQ